MLSQQQMARLQAQVTEEQNKRVLAEAKLVQATIPTAGVKMEGAAKISVTAKSSSLSNGTKQRPNTTSKSNRLFGDDEDEERERTEEQTDEEVNSEIRDYETEEEQGDPYKSYNAFLRLRENFYPIRDSRSRKCYRRRYSLLNAKARRLEYVRFGLHCGFDRRLYPSVYRRYYRWLRQQIGEDTGRPLVRRVDTSALVTPEFYFDDRDEPRMTDANTNNRQNDVPCPSYVFDELPMELQEEPEPHSAAEPTDELGVVRQWKKQRLRWLDAQRDSRGHGTTVSRGPNSVATAAAARSSSGSPDDDGDDSPDYSSENDNDNEVYAKYTKMRKSLAAKGGGHLHKNPAGHSSSDDDCPELERDAATEVNFDRVARKTAGSSAVKDEDAKGLRISPSFQFKQAHMAEVLMRTRQAARESTARQRQALGLNLGDWNAAAAAKGAPAVKRESTPSSFAAAVAGTNSSDGPTPPPIIEAEGKIRYHPKMPYGVLTGIWADIDRQTRNVILSTRDTHPVTHEFMSKKEKDARSAIPKFDGNVYQAPDYYNHLCMKLGEAPFSTEQAVRIMVHTMTSTGRTWILSTLSNMSEEVEQEDKFVNLLGKFRSHYLSPTQASYWRKQLQVPLRAKADRQLSMRDFEVHYGTFVRVLANLRVCDREMQERDAITYYLETMPDKIYTYVCSAARDLTTLDAVHQAARGAIRTIDDVPDFHSSSRRSHANVTDANAIMAGESDLDGLTTGLNALALRPVASSSSTSSTTTSDGERQYARQMQRHQQCFHCGDMGHLLYDCAVRKANRPQTPSGVIAYAQWQRKAGRNEPYDAEAICAARRDGRGGRFLRGGGGRFRPRRRNVIPVTEDDDDAEGSDDNTRGAAPADSVPAAAPRSALASSSSSSGSGNRPRQNTNGGASTHSSLQLVDVSALEIDSEWDDTGEKQVFRYHSMNSDNDLVSDENKTAMSLCIPVTMNGVAVGTAMVDQGCLRTLMRRSAFVRSGLQQHGAVVNDVENYFVETASGHLIPIKGRFMANIASSSDGTIINDSAVVYLVEDDGEFDINCDIVLGRHSIACSRFRMIDTLNGRLTAATETGGGNGRALEFVQCLPCKPCRRADGKRDLQPVAAANTMTVSNSPTSSGLATLVLSFDSPTDSPHAEDTPPGGRPRCDSSNSSNSVRSRRLSGKQQQQRSVIRSLAGVGRVADFVLPDRAYFGQKAAAH
jgi:hypothetical protein